MKKLHLHEEKIRLSQLINSLKVIASKVKPGKEEEMAKAVHALDVMKAEHGDIIVDTDELPETLFETKSKKMKKPKLQEQITKLYQKGAQQELRMEIRKLIKENLQEWEERFLRETNFDPEQEISSLGIFKDPDDVQNAVQPWGELKHFVRDELEAKGINPEEWNSSVDTFLRENNLRNELKDQ